MSKKSKLLYKTALKMHDRAVEEIQGDLIEELEELTDSSFDEVLEKCEKLKNKVKEKGQPKFVVTKLLDYMLDKQIDNPSDAYKKMFKEEVMN